MVYVVAVVGYGRMGLIHARNSIENPRLRLKYLVGRNETGVKTCAAQFDGVQAVTDLSIPLSDPEVNGIIICSPTESHSEQIIQVCRFKLQKKQTILNSVTTSLISQSKLEKQYFVKNL